MKIPARGSARNFMAPAGFARNPKKTKKKNFAREYPFLKMSVDADKQRRWCFTLFVTEDVHSPILPDICQQMVGAWDETAQHFKCGVYQLERAPETGRVHFQGYLEFDAPVRRSFVLSHFFPAAQRPHLEPARGSWKQNEEYCTKEDTRVAGTHPEFIPSLERWTECHQTQGKRSDLSDAVETLRQKRKISEVAQVHPEVFVKYHKGFSALANQLNVPRGPGYKPVCRFYWGPTGSGKTSDVYAEFQFEDIYIKDCSNKWWDGYNGQACVLLDDFDGVSFDSQKVLPITFMLRLLDRYPLQVETKGGHVHLCSSTTTFIITSNRDFAMIYPQATDGHRAALKRRFDEIVEFPNDASRLRLQEYPDSD